ncbi:MAG: hypothetical protein HQL54_01655 [Magnetococcales bacterium]|nr:hypothetical protein [Magnetococcales bacterium]
MDDDIQAGSPRSFGLVFTVFFLIIGLWPLLNGESPRLWALITAGVFLGMSLLLPALLQPLNQLWFRFGLILNKITTPLILGILFFVLITPMALVMRLFGKDPLKLRYTSRDNSYWIVRDDPGPAPESMKHQF